MEKIAILGAGSWGSALTALLSSKNLPVTLWDRDEALVAQIASTGVNSKYLPETVLGETVQTTASIHSALAGAQWVILAVSSNGVRPVLAEVSTHLEPHTHILSAVKGLDLETGLTMSEVTELLLSDTTYSGLAVLSGPNLAKELVRGIPSATVVASADPAVARAAQSLLMTDNTLRVYTHSDVKGVELGGALKNVLAIGGGISDGLGFGDNTKAALMTRGLMEMTQLGVAAGGKALTFLGLSGVGDLMATAGSRLSRNYRVGLGLAQGQDLTTILGDLHQAAEGVPTAKASLVLAKRYGVTVPVFAAIHAVLEGNLSPAAAVYELMQRSARDEFSL